MTIAVLTEYNPDNPLFSSIVESWLLTPKLGQLSMVELPKPDSKAIPLSYMLACENAMNLTWQLTGI